MAYTNKQREKIRVKFAKQFRKSGSVARACTAAKISPSTFYAWNEEGDWKKPLGFSKDDIWGK